MIMNGEIYWKPVDVESAVARIETDADCKRFAQTAFKTAYGRRFLQSETWTTSQWGRWYADYLAWCKLPIDMEVAPPTPPRPARIRRRERRQRRGQPSVAQGIERWLPKPEAAGSNPARGT